MTSDCEEKPSERPDGPQEDGALAWLRGRFGALLDAPVENGRRKLPRWPIELKNYMAVTALSNGMVDSGKAPYGATLVGWTGRSSGDRHDHGGSVRGCRAW